jgi:NADH-quinone oxidoreductase subunit N
MTSLDFYTILPVVILTIWACALLLVDLFVPKGRKGLTAFLAAAGLALTMGITLIQIGNESSGFGGMVVLDGFSNFLSILFLLTGLFGIAVAYGYLSRMKIERGEYYVLMLFSIVGMMLMAQATDLIITFLALELLSIPLYVLAAFAYPRPESEESGLKYFLLGAFATGFVVYGIALTFGATGTTSIPGIAAAVSGGMANHMLLLIGAALILVGSCPLPYVDAGCIPGRAHFRHGFYGRRCKGRRVCCVAACFRNGFSLPGHGFDACTGGAFGADDDRR